MPTLDELLNNDLTVQESWFGLWAPAGTPAEVVAKLHAAVSRALRDPAVRNAFEASGSSVQPSESLQAFAAFVKSENRKWADIVRLANASTS